MPHFLKKLELNGFKSFAGKTVLEFPAGITAIVGPNGSGKSNVVDAVRWLLGERDAQSLRGAKIDDLIFAGTAKRARLGQARASLHFDNPFDAAQGKQFFPVDFSEVSVTREIRRDGVSRYFLNESEILLRDLVDFFAKARLGSRGLIVITQGNSDVFIQATPLTRREMLEEVLGLREYQLKKRDAERRLKNSGINLDKARALAEEILPHLRSLRRQTSRWEKRGFLEEELRGLENAFFGSQLAAIKIEVAEIERRLAASRDELAVLEKEKRVVSARQAEVEASQPEERRELEKIKEQTQRLLKQKSVLEKELGRLEAQIEMAQKTAAAPQAHSAAKLLETVKNIKQVLEWGLKGDLVEMSESVKSALDEINDVLTGGGNGPAVKPAAAAGLEPQFKKISGDLKELESEILDLKNREGELEKNQEKFYQAFKAAVAGVEGVKNKIEKWEAKNREILFAKERLALRREELVRQISQAGRKAEEFDDFRPGAAGDDLEQTERKIFRLRGDLASIGEVDEALMKEAGDAEARYEFLKKESEDLEKAVKDLRLLIEELREKISGEFESALVKINEEFGKFFATMFSGGHAKLKIQSPEAEIGGQDEETGEAAAAVSEDAVRAEEEAVESGGIEIELRLPRKKINSLEMLSGGERSLVSIAALFALISVSPPPFLVLDEIDAALDERNAKRFAEMLKEFAEKTQFVVVTHNRATMEAADVLYGVTLNEDGTSKILSLKLK